MWNFPTREVLQFTQSNFISIMSNLVFQILEINVLCLIEQKLIGQKIKITMCICVYDFLLHSQERKAWTSLLGKEKCPDFYLTFLCFALAFLPICSLSLHLLWALFS